MPAVQSAVRQHTGGTTTLSTAVASGETPLISTSVLDDDFTRCLIEAVKAQPCLYNPSHEHYGNKHSSAQYRIQVWQKLRVELGFKDDAHALQMQWKRIRDRYVRERKRRRNVDSGENNQESVITERERHASSGSNCSSSGSAINVNSVSSSQQFTEMMQWIEPFLVDNMTSSLHTASLGAVASSSNMQHQQIQNLTSREPNNNQGDVKQETSSQGTSINSADGVTVSSYQETSHLQTVSAQLSCEYNALRDHRLSNGSNGDRNTNAISTSATDNGSRCSSTASSEIDVGTSAAAASHSSQQQVVLQQRQRQPLSQHPASMVVLTAVQSQQMASPQQQQPILLPKVEPRPRIGQHLQTADGGVGVVTVTARGVAPVAGVIKKDVNVRTNDGGTVTMIIDPTTFYQHGSQKMYRLVNVSELNTDAVSPNNGMSTVCGELKIVGIPQRRKRVAAVNVQGISNGRGQLGDEIVLDDRISEKTVTIDQGVIPGSEKIVLDQRTATSVAGNTNILLGHNVQQQQLLQQQTPSTSHSHPGISVSPHRANVSTASYTAQMGLQQTSSAPLRQQSGHRFVTQAVLVEHPHYAVLPSHSLQEEHEANLAFANSIANYLSRLNEDEKAVAKMNIQRILMDARFGLGACARMIHDEELNEAAVAAVVSSASHDVISTRRNIDDTSRRLN